MCYKLHISSVLYCITGQNITISDITKLPLFVKSGAIIPMQKPCTRIQTAPLDTIFLEIYPDKKSVCTLYDDDGKSLKYQDAQYGSTSITCNQDEHTLKINISKINGDFQTKPKARTYKIHLNNQQQLPKQLSFDGKKITQNTVKKDKAVEYWTYNKETKNIEIVKKTGNK